MYIYGKNVAKEKLNSNSFLCFNIWPKSLHKILFNAYWVLLFFSSTKYITPYEPCPMGRIYVILFSSNVGIVHFFDILRKSSFDIIEEPISP